MSTNIHSLLSYYNFYRFCLSSPCCIAIGPLNRVLMIEYAQNPCMPSLGLVHKPSNVILHLTYCQDAETPAEDSKAVGNGGATWKANH